MGCRCLRAVKVTEFGFHAGVCEHRLIVRVELTITAALVQLALPGIFALSGALVADCRILRRHGGRDGAVKAAVLNDRTENSRTADGAFVVQACGRVCHPRACGSRSVHLTDSEVKVPPVCVHPCKQHLLAKVSKWSLATPSQPAE